MLGWGLDYLHVTHVTQPESFEGRDTHIFCLGWVMRTGKKDQVIVVVWSSNEELQFVVRTLDGLDMKRDNWLQQLRGEVITEEGNGSGGAKGAWRWREPREGVQ